MSRSIPIVDLFAGPGGLGEGFSSLKDAKGQPIFRIAVSVEKDKVAHRTLMLRAVFRLLSQAGVLESYYAYVKGALSFEAFLNDSRVREAFIEAAREAKCAELGKSDVEEINGWISKAIDSSSDWVLIGGPPCQAYSMAGRSRRVNDANFESDEKHLLYKEYLRIITKFAPPIFVMENVKGILSSKHQGAGIFSRIIDDLSRPRVDLDYEIRAFTKGVGGRLVPSDYIIRSELFGVPQARHRVILLGVRRDLSLRSHSILHALDIHPTVQETLQDLPKIRSRLSRNDGHSEWLSALLVTPTILKAWRHEKKDEVLETIHSSLGLAKRLTSVGGRFVGHESNHSGVASALTWMRDAQLGGAIQHEARSHMPGDLQRYLFASSYAFVCSSSAKLKDFPTKLLPEHENATDEEPPFADRFRVQMRGGVSTTIVSHIAKDGHYYIHFDPAQCRSLTVREAARLQTFPDNYFFQGNRTEQYTQVGNAVPPYLAQQLARSVASLLRGSASMGDSVERITLAA